MEIKIIARIYTDFKEKFGIPRQSGICESVGRIVFEKEYRRPEALRGIEGYSHLWLIWQFSEAVREEWSPTVRPPRLGGNKRMGVFATRSPFRPNPIGLSSVKLDRVEIDERLGPILHVSEIDMLDGTPIYDIKPYLPYSDCHTDAVGGFGAEVKEHKLKVVFPEEYLNIFPECERNNIIAILEQDPRTAYIHDEEREWGVAYAGYNVIFYVVGDTLTVRGVTPL